ncbi:MAG: hypothetical protein FWC73_05900 [Defluviitaleaceae bacterium]|nr:hypothetical protein [Defluviitaleaceae bacterium]
MSKEVKTFFGVGVGFCLAFFFLNVFVLDNDWSMAETLFRTAIVAVVFALVCGIPAYILAKRRKTRKTCNTTKNERKDFYA